MANILANPLIALAPVLLGSLRPGGSLALSGILQEQAGEVQAAYQAGLVGIALDNRDEWMLLQGQRSVSRSAGPGQNS